MNVYVLETGVYEDRDVHGVYATAEAAMAAWQPTPPPRGEARTGGRIYDAATGRVISHTPAPPRDRYTWRPMEPGYWQFDAARYGDEARVIEYELLGEAPPAHTSTSS